MITRRDSLGPRNGGRRTAVMADVAKLAGVSHQTVSRVINDSTHVRPETKQRVLAAMRQLDYRPNPAARALVTGRSGTLGVVSFDTTLYGPGSTLFAIEQAAHAAGYFITIVSLLALDRASVLGAVERLRVQGVDGIPRHHPAGGSGRRARQPARRRPAGGGRGRAPQLGAARSRRPVRRGRLDATQLLLDLGHETVWHVSGPREFLEAQQRVDGWRATLEAAGARVPPVLVGDWSAASGYRVGLQLAEDPEVTAIFVANDQMALGVLRALHERGPRDPGRGEHRRLRRHPGGPVLHAAAHHGAPGLRRDGAQQPAPAARAHAGDRSAPQRVTIAPELVVRRSTAPPPKR